MRGLNHAGFDYATSQVTGRGLGLLGTDHFVAVLAHGRRTSVLLHGSCYGFRAMNLLFGVVVVAPGLL